MSQNPFVFVVGCPRSGTTLLQRMLDSHPQLAVANDTHFIPRALAIARRTAADALDDTLVQAVLAYKRFARLGVPEATARAAAAGAGSYGVWVARLYDEFARLAGKALGGEKTPDYVRHLPLLHGLFPHAKLVHIVRDGRDVALSTLDWATPTKGPGKFALWPSEPLAVCALWWRWQVDSGRSAGARLGPAVYREVSYEHLVAEPERVLRELSAFLGLPYAQAMVEFHVGRERHDPGLSAKKAWLPATGGLRDWRSELAPDDVALFEALAGDLLDALDYPRAGGPRTAALDDRAARCRTVWNDEQARRRARAEQGGAGASDDTED